MSVVAHMIAGEARPSGDRQTFTTVNPATEEPLAEVALAGEREVDDAVRAAWDAYRGGWRTLGPGSRAALLRRLADLIDERGEEIALLESRDTGKPLTSARGDVEEAADLLRYCATLPQHVRGTTYPDEAGFLTSSRRVPYGVVAAIAPWNYPFFYAVAKTAPALACGNTVVFKSAEQTPLSTDLFAQLCMEAGLPAGVVNVVHGGPTTGAALVAHPGVPAITFTGSTEVGRAILATAAERVAHCHLELGGKTPFIVLDDADLEAAAAAALASGFCNAGQLCTAASRLIVAAPVLEPFTELIVEGARALRVGDPADEQTEMGPLVSDEHRRRVQGYVDSARQQGARVLTGEDASGAADGRGFFVAPTVLAGVEPHMTVAREEIFGPVVTLIAVADEAEAIAVANDTHYGLAAAVWTRSIDRALRVADTLEAGTVSINTVGRDPAHVPYEGHKQSGTGEDKGLEVIGTFTQLKVSFMAYRERGQ
jgi:acyl-CoA reductase-like NAD-dependent aldehyde dehydrogenase